MADLSVSAVSVRFGGVHALDDVNLEVAAGTVHGLIGPNGAGKTTLFNVITGLQTPQHGRICFGNVDITRSPPHHRARLGIARTFQRLELFGTMTAKENLRMAAETQRRKLPVGSTPSSLADALLERVGLTHVTDEPCDMLPTGLARLVELARALATSPSVLLLDEPSAGLNGDETAELGRVLTELAGHGMAILLVEHDMSLVMSVCQNITVLDFGVVVASGDPSTVQADPAVQAAYLGDSKQQGHTEAPARPDTAPVMIATNGAAAGPPPGPPAGPPMGAPVGPPMGAPLGSPMRAPMAPPNGAPVGPPVGAPMAPPNGAPVGPPVGAPISVTAAVPFAVPAMVANGSNGSHHANGASAAMLELDDVHAAYGRIEVLHGVTLRVPERSVLALLGPNGAGKSTLLKVASGRMAPSSGTVRYEGESIKGVLPERLTLRGLCCNSRRPVGLSQPDRGREPAHVDLSRGEPRRSPRAHLRPVPRPRPAPAPVGRDHVGW